MDRKQAVDTSLDQEREHLMRLFLEEAGFGGSAPPPIPRREGAGHPPLSFAQQRLWFLDQLAPGNPAYNVTVAVRLTGHLRTAALERSLAEIVRRHEALRTVFAEEHGRPVQVVRSAEAAVPRLAVVDLSQAPEGKRHEEGRRLAKEEGLRPFDLSRGPLLRAVLLRLAPEDHVLVATAHHIVSDGWSMGILTRELAVLYDAFSTDRASPLSDLPLQYGDFAAWQVGLADGEGFREHLDYWREQLRGPLPVLALPTDHPRPSVQTHRGARERFVLPSSLVAEIKALAQGEGATLFIALLAVFDVLLHRYTGQRDIPVGTPIANRTRAETEGMIGFFVNTLLLRTDLSGDPTFRELLRRVRETTLGAYAHQDLPFERLVAELQPERSLSHQPLFQVLFVLQNAPLAPLALTDLELTRLETDLGTAKFDLTLVMEEAEGSGHLEYNTDLFDRDRALRMVAHFQTLLESLVARPDHRLSKHRLLPEQERRQLLRWGTAPHTPDPGHCMHELFEAQVERNPDAVAVVFEGTALTYRELNRRANALALVLRRCGVGPEARVGLFTERSLETVVGLIAVLKAGGAYVPLDAGLPRERLALLARDAELAVILTQSRLADRLPEGGAPHLLYIDPMGQPAPEVDENPRSGAKADNLAYVIYTSGSTGSPKGVCITHRSLVNYVSSIVGNLELSDCARFAIVSTFAADLGHTVLFPSLATGGSLHVVSEERAADAEAMAEYFERHPVDCLKIVPSHLSALLGSHRPARVLPRRRLILGGEGASWELIERVRALAPECVVFNHYGPTETTVGVMTWRADETPGPRTTTLPLAPSLRNTHVYLLDACLEPVPLGVSGEVYIGGEALARGYLNGPGLTAERFVPDPFSGTPGARLYRTGDLARWLPRGHVEILGRRDDQVKIRGFRIEPREIERTLAAHPALRECAVLVRAEEDGEKRLVAYVVYHAEASATAAELRSFLKERLPEPMIPAAFVTLATLPLTPNGKLDRRALPAPENGSAGGERASAAPRSPVEDLLSQLWARLLGLERVGVQDDFFELGGHSLLATRLMSEVRETFHVQIPLRDLFSSPTVAGLARHVEAARREQRGLPLPPLVPASRVGELPLSSAQQRLWFAEQLVPGSTAYIEPWAVRLVGPLDVPALERSFTEIVRRHEILRTTIPTVEGRPFQIVAPESAVTLPLVDLRSLPLAEREGEVGRLVREEAGRPFDLGRGPLVRVHLFRLDEEEHVLLLATHHIVSDGWSVGVVGREMTALYEAFSSGKPSPLPPLAVQYADFAVWQQAWLSGEGLEAQLSYWRKQLHGAPSTLGLPTDRPRPAAPTRRATIHSFAVTRPLSDALRRLGQREGVTLFMTLLAAFKALLGRHTGQTDIVVGSPVANRTRSELEGLIGFFVNTLALRTDLSGDPTFKELLGRVRETVLGASDNQDLPFEKVVEHLRPRREAHRSSPLFQVMFGFQNGSAEAALSLPGIAATPVPIDIEPVVDLVNVFLTDAGDALTGTVVYAAELFEASTITRTTAEFETLLEGIVANPERRLSELFADAGAAVVDAAEVPVACVHELFEARAAERPEAVAVVCGGETVTYGELNRRGNAVARVLQQRGVGPESVVGVCLERSVEMVVGLLGVLKAGGAYLPLDPVHPPERLAFMVEDARTRVVLTRTGLRHLLPGAAVEAICVDAQVEAMASEVVENPTPGVGSAHLAYVIYTSGSTGKPKGVQVEHGGLLNLVRWHLREYSLSTEDRTTQVASPGFDASAWEIWPTLSAGACLCVPEEETRLTPARLRDWLVGEGITISFLPTPLAEAVLSLDWPARPALRALLTGGDRLRRHPSRPLGFALVNHYGPTECTVLATAGVVPSQSESKDAPSIGRPIANTRVHILDADLQTVPVGVAGELYIGGAGVGRGYVNRPALSAERFIPDPFAEARGARLYRTGDLARYRPDGEIEFLGRIDDQVKVRGYRIELGEIESALLAHPWVRDAVVVVREDGSGEKRLVGYVVLDAAESVERSVVELRTFLRGKLPEYMVPGSFVTLDALPLTANGKVDRRALPTPKEVRGEAAEAYVAPRTEVERALARIWAEVLGLEQVGIHDDFLELGGDSIRSVQVVARAREAGLTLTLTQLFEHPTISALAAVVSVTPKPQAYVTRELVLTAAQRRWVEGPGSEPAVEDVYPLSPMQQGMLFHTLAVESGSYWVQASFEVEGPLDAAAFRRALERVVERHASLRTSFVWEGVDEPLQVVHRRLAVPVVEEDWRGLSAADRDARLAEYLSEDRRRGFDLSSAPLFRVGVFQEEDETHRLAVSCHHLILDGWSMSVVLREACLLHDALRRGMERELAAAPRFRDYLAWRQAPTSGAEAFWRKALAGFRSPTPLGLDRLTDVVGENPDRHGWLRLDLPPSTREALEVLARAHRLTLGVLLRGAWALVLSRHSGEEDVVFGAVVSGRPAELPGVERMVGPLINTVPVRLRVSLAAPLVGWLQHVQAWERDARPYEHSALSEVTQWSEVAGGQPLFHSLLVFQNYPAEDGGDALRVRRGRSVQWTNFPVTLLVEPGTGLSLEAIYDRRRLEEPAVARMLGHLGAVLEEMASRPGARVGELSLLGEAERRQVLVEWNDTDVECPVDVCVHELFEARAKDRPRALAVKSGVEAVTYAELNARANALARVLRERGVGPESVVGVCLERSVDMVVGLLGVLKAGGAYLPLDPVYPAERLAFMVEDTRARVVLTRTGLSGLVPPGVEAIYLDAEGQAIAGEVAGNPTSGVGSAHLAYVIYTSGSTGTPKGVQVEHGGLLNLVRWHLREYAPGAEDRTTQVASPGFDVSAWEIWTTLAAGSCLCVPDEDTRLTPERLRDWLVDEGITIGVLPTPLAEAVLSLDWPARPALRALLTAGDRLRRHPQDPLSFVLVNAYGPTECTVLATAGEVPCRPGSDESPSIGRPLPNMRVYILDERLQPVPVGVAGELYIGGMGVGRGYVNRPALTAERFIPDPFGGVSGARLYRTGDLTRYRADGEIEFLGRIDHQVKVRGYRIELGEIESVLLSHPRVKDGVVVAREDGSGQKRLVGYVVLEAANGVEGSLEVEGSLAVELRSFLRGKLPEYMVPGLFVTLEALPLTTNGKVDRRALPAPEELSGEAEEAYVAPRTDRERALVRIWADVLGLERAGIHDDFLELGGDSIKSVQLVARAREAGLAVTLRQLYEHPTVAALAAVVSVAPEPETHATRELVLTAAQRRWVNGPGAEPGVEDVYPLSPMQQGMLFHTVYAPDSREYVSQAGLLVAGPLDVDALRRSLEQVVERHSSLRTSFVWEGVDEPLQVVHRRLALPFETYDWSELSPGEREQRLEPWLEAARRDVDLTQPPLLRADLFRLQQDVHRLVLTYHHLLLDGWSLGVVLRELQHGYDALVQGEAARLPAVRPYRDFVAWVQDRDLATAEAFWQRRLAGFTAPTPLGGEVAAPERPAVDGDYARQDVLLSSATTAALRSFSQQHHLTLNVVLQGAWALLLSRYSGESDVVFGAVVSGRAPDLPGMESMVGLLVNTLPVRTAVPSGAPLLAWLQELQARDREAREHEHSPLVRVQRWSDVRAGLPLFESVLVFQNSGAETSESSGLRFGPPCALSPGATNYALTLEAEPGPALSLRMTYDRRRFDEDHIARILGHLEVVLTAFGARPEATLSEVSLLSEEERHQVLRSWNEPRSQAPDVDDDLARLAALSEEEVDSMLEQALAESGVVR